MKHPAAVLAITLICAAVLAIVCYGGQGGSTAADRGKSLYENYCGDCHGISGKGDGPSARALGSPPTNFTNPGFWGKDAEKRIRTAVRDGYGTMPPLDLKSDEIKAVSDYMSRAFRK